MTGPVETVEPEEPRRVGGHGKHWQPHILADQLKGFFFQKVRFVVQISKSPKKIIQKTILSLKFKFPTNNSKALLGGNLNFKFRIVFWNISFLRFGDLKNEIILSEKKNHL